MKLISLISLIGGILQIRHTFCLESSSFCLRTKNQCKNETCEMKRCTGNFKFRCDFETCSSNITSCNFFENLKKKKKFIILPFAYQVRYWHFLKFIKSIKECPYNWVPNDICVRGTDCSLVHEIRIENGMFRFYEEIECSCENLYDVNCSNRNYCGKNSNACFAIELGNLTSNIKPCQTITQVTYNRIE